MLVTWRVPPLLTHQTKPTLETPFQITPFGSLLSCRVQVLEWTERKKNWFSDLFPVNVPWAWIVSFLRNWAIWVMSHSVRSWSSRFFWRRASMVDTFTLLHVLEGGICNCNFGMRKHGCHHRSFAPLQHVTSYFLHDVYSKVEFCRCTTNIFALCFLK